MKTISFLIIFAILAISSCSKAKTSNISVNNSTQPVNSVNTNSPLMNSNLSNQSRLSETKSEVNSDILKQIEAQQLETADPRKAAKQDQTNNNQPPKKTTSSSGKQTW
jgi:hypothetical protein